MNTDSGTAILTVKTKGFVVAISVVMQLYMYQQSWKPYFVTN